MGFFGSLMRRFGSSSAHFPPLPESVPVNMTNALSEPSRILLVPFNRVGTVLFATRTFKSFRRHYSNASISVAVHKALSPLVSNDRNVNEIITFDDFLNRPDSEEFKSFRKNIAEKEFDIAVFLSYQYDRSLAYLVRMTEANLRIAFAGWEYRDYFNIQVVPSKRLKYEGDRYLELIRGVGIKTSARELSMEVDQVSREKAIQRFLPSNIRQGEIKIAGFDLTRHIDGDEISKKNVEFAIKTLVKDLKMTVAVFFEPGRKKLAAELKNLFGRDIILVEDRPVSIMAGMLSICNYAVAHNTDLLQLASAMKLPTIAILTKEEMFRWSPGEGEHMVHLEYDGKSWPAGIKLASAVHRITSRIEKPEKIHS